MTAHRIVCTTQEPAYMPHKHAHIVFVGTGSDPDRADRKWTLAQVLAAMRTDSFYTQGETSGKVAQVYRVKCACGRDHITTAADAVWDNNLDNLRRCSWT